MYQKNIYVLLFLMLILFILVTGCGPRRPTRYQTEGIVQIDGVPLTGDFNGFVRFLSKEGKRPSVGKIDPKTGHFVLANYETDDGCQPGDYYVEVVATNGDTKKVQHFVPPRYNDYKTSGLTQTVSGKKTDITIHLEWKPSDAKYKGKYLPVH
ncbi:MAG: hypothetical protein Q4C70_08065 [Planctomycetia bacterium]|nr:hypothetical protein [Planctomycetia bacterium]